MICVCILVKAQRKFLTSKKYIGPNILPTHPAYAEKVENNAKQRANVCLQMTEDFQQ